jgi:hypothetical protein
MLPISCFLLPLHFLKNRSRMKKIWFVMIVLSLCAANQAFAQDEAIPDTAGDNVLLERQWGLGGQINTNGWGLRFRWGKNVTALRQWMYEIEFTTYKNTKEVRVINPYYPDAKSYIYGKLNYLYFLYGGTGNQFIITRKPYWGGVQLSAVFFGGVSLGLTKPVYLYIAYPVPPDGQTFELREEKYNPAIHYTDNIYGRASFLSGITQLGFYPGLYIRSALEFEFGNLNKHPKAVEFGGVFNYSPIPVPIMAYNPKQSLFLTLYISMTFGKRYNKL